MCHYWLHVHTCGDSYFTKYSSCSFDRATHHPDSLLNPLHPLVRPTIPASQVCSGPPPTIAVPPVVATNPATATGEGSRQFSGSAASSPPKSSQGSPATQASPPLQNAHQGGGHVRAAGGTLPNLPYSVPYIKGEASKCYIFEVVLQTQEMGVCPACARSPRRRNLPARARGCFAVS